MARKFSFLAPLAFLAAPLTALAHEVYVLDSATIEAALATKSPNPFTAYFGNEQEFFFWGLVSVIVLSTIVCATIFRLFEKSAGPFLNSLKRFAHPIVRITAGLSLISFAYAGELFGHELPFSELFGAAEPLMQAMLYIFGAAVLAGVYVRHVALAMLGVYAYTTLIHGGYMLTYLDHFGSYIFLAILGGGRWSLPLPWNGALSDFFHRYGHYAFPILRACLGLGVMFAAIYAKYIHSQLALEVVIRYDLTRYFPFDPLFVVLGALIIEFLAGLMLFLGIAVRWTGVFLLFWLTLSLLYFQEAVWPHIILFGLCFAFFCHGYDRFSLEGFLLKKHSREPVL